jgi:hypothetical protein
MAANPHEDRAADIKKRQNIQGIDPKTVGHGVKSEILKNPTEGSLPFFAGDYELQTLTLTTPNRKGYINLKAAWSDFNIYEDLFADCLTANIQIQDSVGLLESVPIIGEETINIKVKTAGITKQREPLSTGPFAGSQNEGIINLKFRVTKISNITRLNEGTLTYKLSMISEEYILNLKQKVKKSSLDPVSLEPRAVSDVVRSLYRQFFEKGRISKKIFIEPTKNPTNLIIPNYTPFKAFNFLASRAVSAGKHAVGSSFVFYETVNGFFFVSLETLMAGGGTGYGGSQHEGAVMAAPGAPRTTELVYTAPENPVKEIYVVRPKRTRDHDEPRPEFENVAAEMTAVDDYTFSSNFDVLENLSKGMYTNTLLTHDLVRMTYDRLQFDMYDVNELGTETIMPIPGGPDVIEIKEFVKAAKDARTISDKFTHLEKWKLCTPNQDALRKQPTKEEALLCFYPTNLNHDVVFGEDLGAEAVSGGIKSSLNIVPNRVEQWMQSRIVQSQQINNIKLNIRAPGFSTRTVGDLIEFKLPTQFLDERGGEVSAPEHKYLSGYYLITKLRHHFTAEKYEIEFEAIKDSLSKSVDEARGSEVAQDPSAIANQVTPNPHTR